MLPEIISLDSQTSFFNTFRAVTADTSEEITDIIMDENNHGFQELGGGLEVAIHTVDAEQIDSDAISEVVLAATNLALAGKTSAIYLDGDPYTYTYFFITNPQNLSLDLIRARYMDAIARLIAEITD
jgi:hypothetical protein